MCSVCVVLCVVCCVCVCVCVCVVCVVCCVLGVVCCVLGVVCWVLCVVCGVCVACADTLQENAETEYRRFDYVSIFASAAHSQFLLSALPVVVNSRCFSGVYFQLRSYRRGASSLVYRAYGRLCFCFHEITNDHQLPQKRISKGGTLLQNSVGNEQPDTQ